MNEIYLKIGENNGMQTFIIFTTNKSYQEFLDFLEKEATSATLSDYYRWIYEKREGKLIDK